MEDNKEIPTGKIPDSVGFSAGKEGWINPDNDENMRKAGWMTADEINNNKSE